MQLFFFPDSPYIVPGYTTHNLYMGAPKTLGRGNRIPQQNPLFLGETSTRVDFRFNESHHRVTRWAVGSIFFLFR